MPFRKSHFLPALIAVAAVGLSSAVLAQPTTKPTLTQRLGELLSESQGDELLEPSRAFTVTLSVMSPDTLVAELTPARGYYLYRDRIGFKLKDAKGVAIKTVTLPKGKVKNDPTFGKTETYASPVRAEISLKRPEGARTIKLVASYQGCHETTGVCYPPMTSELKISLP